MKKSAFCLFLLAFVVAILLCLAIRARAQSKSGLRLTATPHSTTLTWTQAACPSGSTCGTVTGNNVYKCTASPCPTPTTPAAASWSNIDTATSPITTFTDTSVTPLQQASYYVTATCTSCSPGETVPSSVVTATTPGNTIPSAPTGLAASQVQ